MKGAGWWAFLVVLFILATIADRDTLAMLVLMLALTTVVSARWGRNTLNRVSYRRIPGKSSLRYGEETSLAIEITNAKLLPLAWLRALDVFPLGLTISTTEIQLTQARDTGLLVTLVSLRWYERVRHNHRIAGTHRGRFVIGPAELTSADIFGFNRSYRAESETDVITVYPKIVPVEELAYPAGRPVGEWRGRRRIIEDPLRFLRCASTTGAITRGTSTGALPPAPASCRSRPLSPVRRSRSCLPWMCRPRMRPMRMSPTGWNW